MFIGHGTRRRHGIEEFMAFLRGVVEREIHDAPILATCAFLELEAPTIRDAVEQLVQAGATKIAAIPLLLFAAGHMKVDIPTEIHHACAAHPHVTVRLFEPFGMADAFRDVAAARAIDALKELVVVGHGSTDAQDHGADHSGDHRDEDVGLVVLGRGNRDEAAQAQFAQVAVGIRERVSERFGEVSMQLGYLAGTGVSLESALDVMVAAGRRRIAILPYLWFSGWLTDTLPDRVEKWRAANPHVDVEIVVARHLGADTSLVEVVAEQVRNLRFDGAD